MKKKLIVATCIMMSLLMVGVVKVIQNQYNDAIARAISATQMRLSEHNLSLSYTTYSTGILPPTFEVNQLVLTSLSGKGFVQIERLSVEDWQIGWSELSLQVKAENFAALLQGEMQSLLNHYGLKDEDLDGQLVVKLRYRYYPDQLLLELKGSTQGVGQIYIESELSKIAQSLRNKRLRAAEISYLQINARDLGYVNQILDGVAHADGRNKADLVTTWSQDVSSYFSMFLQPRVSTDGSTLVDAEVLKAFLTQPETLDLNISPLSPLTLEQLNETSALMLLSSLSYDVKLNE